MAIQDPRLFGDCENQTKESPTKAAETPSGTSEAIAAPPLLHCVDQSTIGPWHMAPGGHPRPGPHHAHEPYSQAKTQEANGGKSHSRSFPFSFLVLFLFFSKRIIPQMLSGITYPTCCSVLMTQHSSFQFTLNCDKSWLVRVTFFRTLHVQRDVARARPGKPTKGFVEIFRKKDTLFKILGTENSFNSESAEGEGRGKCQREKG